MADNDNGKRRFRRGDEQLLLALASGCSIRQAAGKVKLGEATIARCLLNRDFRRRLDEIRRDMLDRAVGLLASTLTAASSTLRKLLRAKSETVRLGAARSILEMHCKLREAGELAREMAELRAELEEVRRGRGSHAKGGGGDAAEGCGDAAATGPDRPVRGAGADPPRPGGDDENGWVDPGPLAGDIAPLFE